jgi:hypothetical protein
MLRLLILFVALGLGATQTFGFCPFFGENVLI